MAEEKQDNTFTVVAIVTALAIGGVVLLKARETQHLQNQAETTAAAEAQVLKAHKDFNNDVLKAAK